MSRTTRSHNAMANGVSNNDSYSRGANESRGENEKDYSVQSDNEQTAPPVLAYIAFMCGGGKKKGERQT